MHADGLTSKLKQARRVLEKIRGTRDVDEEYQDILEKAELASMVKNPWTLLLFRKKYRCSTVPISPGTAHGMCDFVEGR
jgi:hypothetical protein